MHRQRIGNYQVLRKLGAGGIGAIFEAVHEGTGRRAAVKVLHPDYSQSPHTALRFFNVASCAGRVRHPGMVEIFEFGCLPDGPGFLAMECLQGESLSVRLQRQAGGPLPSALRVAQQIAQVLKAAHQEGLVHYDLKPGHIMLVPAPDSARAPDGELVKVLDFGSSRVAGGLRDGVGAPSTRTGLLMGTPAYMAPEQCRGATKVDDRVDVYALGALLYHMLAGRPPFVAEGTSLPVYAAADVSALLSVAVRMGEVMARHMCTPPRALHKLVPEVPEEVSALVHAMLAKIPAERPAMDKVAARLLALAGPAGHKAITGATSTRTLTSFGGRLSPPPRALAGC